MHQKLLSAPPAVRWVISAAVLAAGIIASYIAAQRMGVDFASLHAMGRAIVARTDVYDPAWKLRAFPEEYGLGAPPGMFYPPATGFSVVPFGVIPYELGKLLWFLTLCGGVVAGVRALVKHTLPDSGAPLWMLLAGVVLMTSAMRWGMTPLQGAPMMFGLLCFFVVALARDQRRLSLGIALFAMAFKMTLALPFLAMLGLYRRWGAIAVVCGSWVVLNALGFWLMGSASLAHYRQGMGVVEALNDINTPNPWLRISIPRLDWTYLLYGLLQNLTLARVASLSLAGVTGLILGWFALRTWQTPTSPNSATSAAFLASAVCLGSLCVYHHQYDVSLFIAPLLLALDPSTRRVLPRATLLLSLPLVAIMAVLPVGKVQSVLQTAFPPSAIGLFNMSFPIFVSLALVGSLLALASAVPAPVATVDRRASP